MAKQKNSSTELLMKLWYLSNQPSIPH